MARRAGAGVKGWLVLWLVVGGCGRAPRPSRAPVAGRAPLADASVPSADASVARVVATDPLEPTPPQIECLFDRHVFCQVGLPTRTALQASPFEWCARTQPAQGGLRMGPDDLARFSARETRTARQTRSGACCYIEFDVTACR